MTVSHRRLLLALALAAGCGEKDVDSAAETGFCATAPVSTWENFGAGFFTQECQSCHASESPERNGAPDVVTFDSEEEVLAQVALVLEVATGEEPTMPPEGGVREEDRYMLEAWLRCVD